MKIERVDCERAVGEASSLGREGIDDRPFPISKRFKSDSIQGSLFSVILLRVLNPGVKSDRRNLAKSLEGR
jgi:hypothetical protein